MPSKKKIALLMIQGSNSIEIPTERYTWLEHPVVEDSSWKQCLNDPVKKGPAFEFVGSESTGNGIPLSHDVYRTMFRDNSYGEGSVIALRSILRMRVGREEVPMYDIRFESKAQRH